MPMKFWRYVFSFGFSLVLTAANLGEARHAFANKLVSSNDQKALLASAATRCPNDLSDLRPEMEKALQYIKSAAFRETMLASLEASIPEAISQADGLSQQITFLKQEIVKHERERTHAETVAREGLEDPSQPLKPCRHGKESAYCYAMDQYLISTAANLANRAFLEVLQCYQREGVR